MLQIAATIAFTLKLQSEGFAMKSSEVRKDLTKLLSSLLRGEVEEIDVEVNGEAVAVITKNEPALGTPAIYLKAEEAREDWAGILETVAIQNARYFFKRSGSDEKIYLRKHRDYRHSAARRWRAHVNAYRDEKTAPLTLEDLMASQEDLGRKVEEMGELLNEMRTINKLLFARIERGGDLFRTPENGVIRPFDAGDLDRYEAE
jgi:hypothetical protein